MKIFRSRLLRGVTTVLAIATLTMTGATTAAADPIILPTEIDGTLTIHKNRTPADSVPGNGLELFPGPQGPANPPVPGIVFTVTRLDFDLRTNAGWADLTAMDIADVADHVAAAAQPLTATDADGVVEVTLPVAAYYVEETGFGPGVTPVAPFIVTIPMTHPIDLDTWLYDVHVYPKNAITAPPVKTVVDADIIQLGQEMDFVITSEITEAPTDQVIDGYRIRDVLDTRLDFVRAEVEFSTATPDLVVDTHYEVTEIGREVRITFLAAGLTLLQANSTQDVVTTITTVVTEVGEITNTATLFPNEASWNSGTGLGVPSDPVDTFWGSIRLTKTVAGSTPTAFLAGAEFRVYASEADALAGDDPITLATNPGDVDDVWVTDVDGRLTIEGLRYSTVSGGGPVEEGDPGYQPYWLVETKAPPGYALLAEPVRVVLDAAIVDVPVADVPLGGGFDLPFTGGAGLWLFPIGGALLIGGGALLLLGWRRRHTDQP